jgi:hypothetical protein
MSRRSDNRTRQRGIERLVRGALRAARSAWREIALAALLMLVVYLAAPEATREALAGAWGAVEAHWRLALGLVGAACAAGLLYLRRRTLMALWMHRREPAQGSGTGGKPSNAGGGPRETLHNARVVVVLALASLVGGAAVYSTYYLLDHFRLAQLATFLEMAALGLIILICVDVTILKDFDTVRELKDGNDAVAGYYRAVAIVLLAAAVASI